MRLIRVLERLKNESDMDGFTGTTQKEKFESVTADLLESLEDYSADSYSNQVWSETDSHGSARVL